MTQQPLFDLPPAAPKLDAQGRLQALVDALYPDDAPMEELLVVRRSNGWYISGPPRWIGDNGLDWIGRDEASAAAYLRSLAK